MSQPIPNLPHFPVAPENSGAVFEQMRNELEAWCRSVADNMGRLVRDSTPPWVSLQVLRVTGSPAANTYSARLQVRRENAVFDPDEDFDPTAVWQDVSDEDDAYLVDANPNSAIPADSYIPAWFQIYNINNLPTFLLMGAGAASFPVDLTNPTGSAGTNSPPAAATYTYDVADAQSGLTLGTGVSVWMARQKGHVTAALKGTAGYIGGTLYILVHDEVLDTTPC